MGGKARHSSSVTPASAPNGWPPQCLTGHSRWLRNGRNWRDAARLELAWALVDALHGVGKQYKKVPAKAKRFFGGGLLLGRGRKKEETPFVNG